MNSVTKQLFILSSDLLLEDGVFRQLASGLGLGLHHCFVMGLSNPLLLLTSSQHSQGFRQQVCRDTFTSELYLQALG
jgi:hypothetical protein